MKIAVYPGTFDPIHNGHIDLLERASKMFDKIIIVISINSQKANIFTSEERMEMAINSLSHLHNVEVVNYDGLLVDYAKQVGAIALIRGIRNSADIDYEMQIASMNKKLSDISTIFLTPDENFLFLSSSIIREIAKYKQDTSNYVPLNVHKKLLEKFN